MINGKIERIKSCLMFSGSDGVNIRSFRPATVCLVLLCVLLLTAVIVLCVTFTQERQQLLTNNTNLIQLNVQINQEKNELSKFIKGILNYTKTT